MLTDKQKQEFFSKFKKYVNTPEYNNENISNYFDYCMDNFVNPFLDTNKKMDNMFEGYYEEVMEGILEIIKKSTLEHIYGDVFNWKKEINKIVKNTKT